jgi:hypothetical protein
MKMRELHYSVKTMRGAGLESRWTRTRSGAPIILARWPKAKLKHQRETWWLVDRVMWSAMQRNGVVPAFDQCTLLGDVFSL